LKIGVPKIRLASSVGVALAENSIAWCVLEKGPFGIRKTDSGEEPCTRQDWANALNKILLKVQTSPGIAASVVIGLPASQAFFATLPSGPKLETAENLLTNNHCCSSIPPQELSADVLPVKVGGKTFAAVGASRKKDLQVLIDVPKKLGFRFVRVEPGPWALLRACAPQRGSRISLRLLVEGKNMLATLVSGSQPLLWRPMELGSEESWDSILSLVRSFETYATQQLALAGIDSIVLEGPSTKELAARLASDLGERFSEVKGPGPTPAATAKGLAVGGMNRDIAAPDLARPLAPPPQLLDLIPRGEVAVLGAVIMCLGLWLWGSGTVVMNDAIRAEEDNSKNVMLQSGDDGKLKDEKKILSAEVQAVSQFLGGRIMWTEYLNQFSGRIPPGVQFVTFQGDMELKTGTEKNERKAKKGLLLNFETMLPRDRPAPPEVDTLLKNIRNAPVVMRDFPEVSLSALRVTKNMDNRKSLSGDPASFTIACLPKEKPKGAPAPKDAGAKDAKGGAVAKAD
jgi:hypothetical protein